MTGLPKWVEKTSADGACTLIGAQAFFVEGEMSNERKVKRTESNQPNGSSASTMGVVEQHRKEKGMKSIMIKLAALAMVFIVMALAWSSPAMAQVANTGVGFLGSSDPNLGDGTISLTPQALAVVKRARSGVAPGADIPGGSTVAVGSSIKFMLYINNKSDTPLVDVSIRDTLAANYVYNGLVDSIKVINPAGACALLACTTAEEDTMFGLADAAAALTNTISGVDAAGLTAGPPQIIDIGDQNVANAQLANVAANSRLVVLFTVTVQ